MERIKEFGDKNKNMVFGVIVIGGLIGGYYYVKGYNNHI
jgi:hypothetical protein